MTFATGGSADARTRSTFGVAKAAQARSDFQVLAKRGRRALRLHLDGDVQEGLTKLEHVVREAFGW